jgi:myo-inositol-1(or 4)-monophosphatase
LEESIVSVGFSKTTASLNKMLPEFTRLVHEVRKIRIMGAAALAMVYVAAGRFEAFVESGVRLWDIASMPTASWRITVSCAKSWFAPNAQFA